LATCSLLNMKKITFLAIAIVILILGYFILSNLVGVGSSKNDKVDQSIAVLPFANMSNDPDQEYFSDGLTEGILNSIAQLKDLKVCARTSSFQFKGQNMEVKEIGKILGVNTIVEGSVQRQEDRVRITVQLINVKDNFHYWSEQYDESLEDIFAVQEKIADAIANKLELTLLSKKEVVISKRPAPPQSAYDLFLKGRSLWNLGTPRDTKKAIELFQQAIIIYPEFARAYAAIADCYNALGYGSSIAPREAGPKAREAATKAIELDSTLAEPHASLGFCKFYFDWDWTAAEDEFRTSLALNPNYEIGYKWYGYFLTSMKRYDEALVILNKAVELDPFSVPISTDLGFSLYYSGKYDEAANNLKRSLQINPRFPLAHIWLGRTYQAMKMYPEAIEEYKSALLAAPDWPVGLAQIGNVYGVSGDKKMAENILDTLKSLLTKKFVTAYGIGLVYAGLDDKEQAFEWLNKAYEERSNWLVWLKTDPRWVMIKSDERFVELVNKVGLPD
jgi:adenylate cyclase